MPKKINDGLKKRCDCPKRRWATCVHPWHLNFQHNGEHYRFSLAKFVTTRDGSMSKSEAVALRDRLRGDIRDGKLTTTGEPVALPPNPAVVTLADVLDAYGKRHVNVPGRRPSATYKMHRHIEQLRLVTVPGAGGSAVCLAAKPIATITRADITAVMDARRQALADMRAAAATLREIETTNATREPGDRIAVPANLRVQAALGMRATKHGEVGITRLLARLRHVFNWAIAEGYLETTPFKRGGVTVVKVGGGEAPRTRRLASDEEDRLLAAANPHLRALIIAALSTGCRVGELLSLTWEQVKRDGTGEARYLDLPGTKTKTGAPRVVPVGTKLRAVLALLPYDAAGEAHPATAHVFGHVETGERVASIKTAWRLACRRAGVSGLRFHDLRREFACRLLESRAELHDVRAFLGHANIATTSRYLQATPVRLERALARMEGASEPTPAPAQAAGQPPAPPAVPASVN